MSEGKSECLGCGEIQFEEGLLDVMVHGQACALLAEGEDGREASPKKGVLFGEVHGLRVRLEANTTKDIICVGEEITTLSLWGTDRKKMYVVNTSNPKEENRGQSERQRTAFWMNNTDTRYDPL